MPEKWGAARRLLRPPKVRIPLFGHLPGLTLPENEKTCIEKR